MSERRPGATRSEAARTAILKATASLFAARGYEHLTIEGIAAEARVGKQTIYRWWPSKSALVAECLIEGQLLPTGFVPPDTGNIRADLTTWLGKLFGYADQPGNNAVLCSLIAAAADNEDVGQRLRESLGAASALTARLNAAIDAAELRPHAPVREIGEALIGAVILHVLTRAPAAPGLARRLVDAVLQLSAEYPIRARRGDPGVTTVRPGKSPSRTDNGSALPTAAHSGNPGAGRCLVSGFAGVGLAGGSRGRGGR